MCGYLEPSSGSFILYTCTPHVILICFTLFSLRSDRAIPPSIIPITCQPRYTMDPKPQRPLPDILVLPALPDPVFTNDRIADLLFEHLDEFGDARSDIMECLNYIPKRGGDVILAVDDNQIVGAVVMNDTGMKGYIPERILVYIAVHAQYRGIGLGKALMQKAIDISEGAIALHVEPDNPAVYLYKKMGFTNKYLEMRLS